MQADPVSVPATSQPAPQDVRALLAHPQVFRIGDIGSGSGGVQERDRAEPSGWPALDASSEMRGTDPSPALPTVSAEPASVKSRRAPASASMRIARSVVTSAPALPAMASCAAETCEKTGMITPRTPDARSLAACAESVKRCVHTESVCTFIQAESDACSQCSTV